MSKKSNNLEMFLTLLVKVIALHMQIAIIKVGVLKFERPVRAISVYCVVSSLSNIDLYELSEKLVDRGWFRS